MSQSKYLTAHEAAERLSVTTATLYSYVSRGLIRSEAIQGDHRQRRYLAEDVTTLVAKRNHRHNPDRVAQEALDWGAPVIESALTLIEDGRLYYRGQDVLHLASSVPFESVVALLWTGDTTDAARLFAPNLRGPLIVDSSLPLLTQLIIHLAREEASDLAAHDLRKQRVIRTGAALLDLATSVFAPNVSIGSMAERLALGWPSQIATDNLLALINAALILCADHELNASSFTARVVASTSATLYQVIIAGLAALQGAKHGGGTNRALALLDEMRYSANVRQTVVDRLRRGEQWPGFGHRLYPNGDPRASFLLDQLRERVPNSPVIQLASELIALVQENIEQAPNIDLALAVLTRTLGWSNESALALFALGRMAGWIGHAIEQYEIDQLIRPRAAYRGQTPKG